MSGRAATEGGAEIRVPATGVCPPLHLCGDRAETGVCPPLHPCGDRVETGVCPPLHPRFGFLFFEASFGVSASFGRVQKMEVKNRGGVFSENNLSRRTAEKRYTKALAAHGGKFIQKSAKGMELVLSSGSRQNSGAADAADSIIALDLNEGTSLSGKKLPPCFRPNGTG